MTDGKETISQVTEDLIKAREELERAEGACPPAYKPLNSDWGNYFKAKGAYDEAERAYRVLLTTEQRLYAVIFGEGYVLPAVPQTIWQVVATLKPIEQIILQLRFGRFGSCNTLQAVSKVLGVTPQRIRQIEQKALRKLRHPIRARVIKAMIRSEFWSIGPIKMADDFIPYWKMIINQAVAQGMKPYAASCLLHLAHDMKHKDDYRTPERLTENDLLHTRGVGPKSLMEIKHFFPIIASTYMEKPRDA